MASELGAPFRLLITGSRRWDHTRSIEQILRYYLRHAVHSGYRLVVVQGEAMAGADRIASDWANYAQRSGWAVTNESHPAEWGRCSHEKCTPGHQVRRPSGRLYCPYAGFARNKLMVDTRPDACVAFWRAGSSGTRDCRARVAEAQIPEATLYWAQRDLAGPQWLDGRMPLARLMGAPRA